MSLKKIYFGILIAAVVVIVVSMFTGTGFIPVSLGILQSMIVDWKIFVPALVCAFAFSKVKYYWLTMLGCSFVTSMVVQVFFFSVKAGLYIICLRAFCFLVVVYIVDYLRLIGKRK